MLANLPICLGFGLGEWEEPLPQALVVEPYPLRPFPPLQLPLLSNLAPLQV